MRIKSCLDIILVGKNLSVVDYNFMKPSASKPSAMYGLCKFYKSTTADDKTPPFCPILSAVGTCSCDLLNFFRVYFKTVYYQRINFQKFFIFSVKEWLVKIQKYSKDSLTFNRCL